MGLSYPHFILFPQGGGVKPHCFSVSIPATKQYVCMTPVENRVVDLFLASNKLAVCIFYCSYCIYCRFSLRSCW